MEFFFSFLCLVMFVFWLSSWLKLFSWLFDICMFAESKMLLRKIQKNISNLVKSWTILLNAIIVFALACILLGRSLDGTKSMTSKLISVVWWVSDFSNFFFHSSISQTFEVPLATTCVCLDFFFYLRVCYPSMFVFNKVPLHLC